MAEPGAFFSGRVCMLGLGIITAKVKRATSFLAARLDCFALPIFQAFSSVSSSSWSSITMSLFPSADAKASWDGRELNSASICGLADHGKCQLLRCPTARTTTDQ